MDELKTLELLAAWLKNPVVKINQHDDNYIRDLEEENTALSDSLFELKRKYNQLEMSYSLAISENIKCYDVLRAHGLRVD